MYVQEQLGEKDEGAQAPTCIQKGKGISVSRH